MSITIDETEEPLGDFSPSGDFTKKFNSPVLSSEVGDIGFLTNQDYAIISVYRSSDSAMIYEARLYPDAQGVCMAWQLGDVITLWMRLNNVTFSSFTFKDSVTGKYMQATILQSSRISSSTDGYISAVSAPLLSSLSALIPHSATSWFYFIPASTYRLQVLASVHGILESGEIGQSSLALSPSTKDISIFYVSVCPDEILTAVNEVGDEDHQFKSISYISISVLAASTPTSIYGDICVSDDPDLIGFEFINCFGLRESIFFHAESLPDVSVNVESASIGHSLVQYDVEHSQHFNLEASNILPLYWPSVSQFLTSSEIYEVSSGRRVFLSDISTDIGKTYDALGSVKFNYHYEDDRLII